MTLSYDPKEVLRKIWQQCKSICVRSCENILARIMSDLSLDVGRRKQGEDIITTMAAPAEFIKLFLANQEDLKAFLASLVRNHDDREDLFQDTVVTIWEKFATFDANRSFGAWARGIAANKVLQHRGRLGRVPTPFSPQAIAAVLDAFQRLEPLNYSESLDALEECMKSLSGELRSILVLRYVEQLPVWKIAETLGSTPAATSKTLSRLRTSLFECVQRRVGVIRQEKAL